MGYFDPEEPQKGLIMKYDVSNYLLSDYIESIERDKRGRFWLLTTAGIECIDPSMNKSIVVDEFYGLQMMDTWSDKPAFQPGVLYKLSNGNLAVGYRRGVGIFNPDSINAGPQEIHALSRQYYIFDKPLRISPFQWRKEEIRLKYNQNYLTFSFSALCLDRGKTIRLFHQLEGIDRDWIESNARSASYSSLRPGKYMFKIRAEQTSGFRSDAETSLYCDHLPPWWNNPLAYLVYFIITGTLIVFIYQFQIRRRLQQGRKPQIA